VEEHRKDTSVLAHIERLVAEEHRLFGQKSLDPEGSKRLADVQVELEPVLGPVAAAARAARNRRRSIPSPCPAARSRQEVPRLKMSCGHDEKLK
jgi:hypothetical protein